MQTIIQLHLSELSEQTLGRIRQMLGAASIEKDPLINIVLPEAGNYESKLKLASRQFEEGAYQSFTMEEFTAYVHSNFGK